MSFYFWVCSFLWCPKHVLIVNPGTSWCWADISRWTNKKYRITKNYRVKKSAWIAGGAFLDFYFLDFSLVMNQRGFGIENSFWPVGPLKGVSRPSAEPLNRADLWARSSLGRHAGCSLALHKTKHHQNKRIMRENVQGSSRFMTHQAKALLSLPRCFFVCLLLLYASSSFMKYFSDHHL